MLLHPYQDSVRLTQAGELEASAPAGLFLFLLTYGCSLPAVKGNCMANKPQFSVNRGYGIAGNLTYADSSKNGSSTSTSGTSLNKYAADFTSGTLVGGVSTLTILGSTHHLGSADLAIAYRDASGNKIEPG